MDKLREFLQPEIIWFLVGLVLIISEFAMPGLIIIFFGVGACVVGIVCVFSESVSSNVNAQLLLFCGSSVVLLLCLRKSLKAIFKGYAGSKQDLRENLDGHVGQKVVVKKEISPHRKGKVELHGTDWDAEADETIAAGDMVEVVARDNLTLKVKRLS